MKPFLPLLVLAAACSDVADPHDHDENEVITTVELTFTPSDGGNALVFTWSDPEDDGDPQVDAVVLPPARAFDLTLRFLDALSDPAEDLTDEIRDEGDQHQVFLTGSAVSGPAGDAEDAVLNVAYADEDAGGLPLGLAHRVITKGRGGGELIVTLRHLPPEGGEPVKRANLAEVVAAEGFGAVPGSTDAQVTFPVTVE